MSIHHRSGLVKLEIQREIQVGSGSVFKEFESELRTQTDQFFLLADERVQGYLESPCRLNAYENLKGYKTVGQN
jgi:hypothetical protein